MKVSLLIASLFGSAVISSAINLHQGFEYWDDYRVLVNIEIGYSETFPTDSTISTQVPVNLFPVDNPNLYDKADGENINIDNFNILRTGYHDLEFHYRIESARIARSRPNVICSLISRNGPSLKLLPYISQGEELFVRHIRCDEVR